MFRPLQETQDNCQFLVIERSKLFNEIEQRNIIEENDNNLVIKAILKQTQAKNYIIY